MSVSAAVAAKTHVFVDSGRVRLDEDGRPATVLDDATVYEVEAREDGIRCSCPAGARPDAQCSHVLAAMAVWSESAK